MTKSEKIEVLVEIRGAYDSWSMQAQNLRNSSDCLFDFIFNKIAESTIDNLEQEIESLQDKIDRLRQALTP